MARGGGGRSFRGKCVILTCGENVKAVTEYHLRARRCVLPLQVKSNFFKNLCESPDFYLELSPLLDLVWEKRLGFLVEVEYPPILEAPRLESFTSK